MNEAIDTLHRIRLRYKDQGNIEYAHLIKRAIQTIKSDQRKRNARQTKTTDPT